VLIPFNVEIRGKASKLLVLSLSLPYAIRAEYGDHEDDFSWRIQS
jgi:hypothetical protein